MVTEESFELSGGLGVVKGGEVEAKTGGVGHSEEFWFRSFLIRIQFLVSILVF